MTRLRPMEDEEYGPYLQVLRDAYIRDILESGLMDRANAETIHLNVFGSNTPARRLYGSLGYTEYSLLMGKTLSD